MTELDDRSIGMEYSGITNLLKLWTDEIGELDGGDGEDTKPLRASCLVVMAYIWYSR